MAGAPGDGEQCAAHSRRDAQPDLPPLRLALSATFTIEPIEATLSFWLKELGYCGQVEFAPYNQVLQQLLDPQSLLATNPDFNVLVVRLEDALRFATPEASRDDGDSGAREMLKRTSAELCGALEAFAARNSTPTVVCVGPPSAAARARFAGLLDELAETLRAVCERTGHVSWLGDQDLARYPVSAVCDERRDEIGHIPYTPQFFTALGTAVARRLHALKAPPIKVIAVDCDNTLWDGVVGEEGPHGISLPEGKLALQRALVRQQELGALICLVSKNVDEDVRAVFRERVDMVLREEHIVAQRVNWQPKSLNIAELAAELNLGIDSFLFIDDNPVECAEMKSAHPQLTTLLLPEDARLTSFIDHVWAFDRLKVTEEDQKRTLMYQQNRQRSELEQKTASIGDFLRTLELTVDIGEPAPDQLSRIAQLTQRTNQFNFTTRRRSEAELTQLSRAGLECVRVNVTDRFGDYGLVGAVIFEGQKSSLRIDTLLLSCRVLGRGVEHQMLAHLGRIATERGIPLVEAVFAPTKKNLPARNFLESLAAETREQGEDTVYVLPSAVAAALTYQPGNDAKLQLELARTGGKKAKDAAPSPATRSRSQLMQRCSSELNSVDAIQHALSMSRRGVRPELGVVYVAPRSQAEEVLANIWQRLLGLDRVGVHDDFQSLGGTSLIAAELFVEIEDAFGVKLPMTTILDASTISLLEERLLTPRATSTTLKRLREGAPNAPQLFLVHDGDGETLLYMNLAQRLPSDMTVWGLEPLSSTTCRLMHTRMEELAAYYITQIRRAQPSGPYHLGGLCAGGTIAFEIALQLERAGDQVGVVALIDAADAKAQRKIALESQQRVSRFLQTFASQTRAADATALAHHVALEAAAEASGEAAESRLQRAARKVGNLLSYEATKLGRGALNDVRFRRLQQLLARDEEVPTWVGELTVREIYERMERDYTPVGTLGATAVLYRATWADAPDTPLTQIYRDPLLGWPKRLAGELIVCDVPGGHSSLLQEPQVTALVVDLAVRLATPVQTGARHHESSPYLEPDRARAMPRARA